MGTFRAWFDDTPKRSLEEKVSRALAHYRKADNFQADTVWVNPATPDVPETLAGLRVKTSKTVLPMHFFLGVSD